MPGKTTWLKAGAVDVRVGVGEKKLKFRITVPQDVTQRLLIQLQRKLKSGK
jgi:hypothetical protein